MKHPLTLVLAFALAQTTQAQKITSFTDPSTHTHWLMTDVANLHAVYKTTAVGDQFMVNFKAAGDDVRIYVQSSGVAIGARDFVAFCMEKDTIVVHSTGPQPGGPLSANYAPPVHEYAMSKDDLRRMSQGGNLTGLLASDNQGMQQLKIFSHADRLAAYAADLLKTMGN